MSWYSSARLLCVCVLTVGALTIFRAGSAVAAAATVKPTPDEQAELAKYDSYSGALHVLEANAENRIHAFFDANEGKTVYLDLSIVRYIPIDPIYLDETHVKASTDRFQNPVFTKCWPDQRADDHGILNFGEAGFPLPLDAKDIEAGCATRVRIEHQMIESVSAFGALWGDNKVQVFLKGFFSVLKTSLKDGKTLYTLKEQEDVTFESRLAFDKHKTGKHPEANLSLQTD